MTLLLPKMDIIRDQRWLDALKQEPCILTGFRGNDYESVDPSHLGAFKGMKRSDNEVLPVRHSLHQLGHSSGEWSQWRAKMPDWLIREALRAYARQLYAEWKNSRRAA